MIYRCLILAVVSATVGFAQSELKAPAARPRLTEERKLSMSSTAPAAKADAGSSSEQAIVMAPVAVTARKTPSAPKEELPKSQPFTLKDGGTFLRREGPKVTTEIKFQFNAKGWDILSFSW